MTRPPVFRFRLFVAGRTSNSVQAMANLAELCRTHLSDQHELEVIDVLSQPHRALAERVFITPMLIKCAPGTERRIIGTLHDLEKVMLTLEVEPSAA